MTLREKISKLTDRFGQLIPSPQTELEFNTPYQLLVATVMAAQATDRQVNVITRTLFRVAPDPRSMVFLGEEGIFHYIRSINYNRTKAGHIYSLSVQLIDEFGGEVPASMEDLQRLPGVGRKTASVVLICAFNIPAFPVDTHVFRVSNRLGIAKAANVSKTEEQLRKRLPESDWYRFHHYLILHGRYTCKAKNPSCETCQVRDLCSEYSGRTRPDR